VHFFFKAFALYTIRACTALSNIPNNVTALSDSDTTAAAREGVVLNFCPNKKHKRPQWLVFKGTALSALSRCCSKNYYGSSR
jgi:hypothetical protein